MELSKDPVLWLVVLAIFVILCSLVILLGYWPGWIAKRRGHPSAEAIRICGFVGLLVWPCWLIAFIWAYTGPDRSVRSSEPDYHLGLHRPPPVPSAVPRDELGSPLPEAKSRRERRGGSA
jgi:hypothetical protein